MNAPLSTSYVIALAATFQKALTRLAPRHQADVQEDILKLQRGHAAVHLHALTPYPWVAFGSNRDALRVICHREGDTLLLVYVDKHDAAYDWAKRNQPRMFGNAIRILPVEHDDVLEAKDPRSEVAQVTEPSGPLSFVRPKDLLHFGVHAPTAALLRGLPDEDTLVDLCTHLTPPLAEALIALATDPDDLAGTLNRFRDADERGHTTLREALSAPTNAATVWLPPPGQAALEAALEGAMTSWRIFLHPSQRRLARLDASGPVKVTGGPGTGKSVVALHRARYLAEEVFVDDERPVLVCTFSRVLARRLTEDLDALCADVPAVRARIDVRTLSSTAQHVHERLGSERALLLGEPLDAAWQDALELDANGRGRALYEAERELVVLPQDVRTLEEYRSARRTGRKARVSRGERDEVWAVLSRLEEALSRRKGSDPLGLAHEARRSLEQSRQRSPWSAVVCDELQDASASELRLLAALAKEGAGRPGPNRLFLVGDGHQRLYQRPISLAACGIEVRGRSHRLRLNYRTTQGICEAAVDYIAGVELDELDRDDDESESAARTPREALRGYRSIRAGAPPEQRTFASLEEEADWIAARAREGALPLLVLARTRRYLEELRERLLTRGASPLLLGEGDGAADAEVLLATLHRAKGLEAPSVVVAGMHTCPLPWPGESAGEKERWLRQERSLVYVGMTRARDWCGLSRVSARRPT